MHTFCGGGLKLFRPLPRHIPPLTHTAGSKQEQNLYTGLVPVANAYSQQHQHQQSFRGGGSMAGPQGWGAQVGGGSQPSICNPLQLSPAAHKAYAPSTDAVQGTCSGSNMYSRLGGGVFALHPERRLLQATHLPGRLRWGLSTKVRRNRRKGD